MLHLVLGFKQTKKRTLKKSNLLNHGTNQIMNNQNCNIWLSLGFLCVAKSLDKSDWQAVFCPKEIQNALSLGKAKDTGMYGDWVYLLIL